MRKSPNTSRFVQQSQEATDYLLRTCSAFIAPQKPFGNKVEHVPGLRVGVSLWITLWWFRRRLRALYVHEISWKAYKTMRLEYDELNNLSAKMEDCDLLRCRQDVPWFLNISVRLGKDIFDLIHRRRDVIGRILTQLDATAPCTDLLQPIAEKDLWVSRTTVYDYRF